ncbi:MAG: hypothetical protein ABJB22_00745 [Verrucomicrobiota bacterium]
MKPKSIFHVAAFAPLLGAISALAADDLPKAMAFARYNPMLDHSPFAVATAAAPVVAAPDFAKDLFISNAAHSPDGDLVTLQSSSDRNLKEYLTTKNPVHGYSISNIDWSDRVGATKVTIGKNGQFATLSFNESLLTQTIQNAGQPGPAVGMVPQANPIKFPQGGPILPTYPTPVPRVRGPIPRRPGDSAKAANAARSDALQAAEAAQAMESKTEKEEK